MSTYLGMNAATGAAISDDDHIRQSIADILTTPLGSRIQRRDYGSRLPDLLDYPIPVILLPLIGATAMAIQQFEPRVTIASITPSLDDMSGKLVLAMEFFKTSGGKLQMAVPV
jgi:phage baseplate assembly protein W